MATDTNSSPSGVILITGASRGLGLGLACLLAEQHVPMLLTSRDERLVCDIAARLRTRGAPVAGVGADAADPETMEQAFRVAKSLGPLDGVVNNAGQLEPIDPVKDIDVRAFDRHVRVNLTGVLNGIQKALRHREAGRTLRIVNVASGAATHPYAGWAAYCSSKAAVAMLTQVAAAENDDGLTSVASVAPGIVETAMQQTLRSMPASKFPAVGKFVHYHETGALLSPVDGALTLDWLVRAAPLSLSGHLVDAHDPDIRRQVQQYLGSNGSSLRSLVLQATELFGLVSAR